MKNVKFALIATSILASGLCLGYGALSLGGHGIFALVCCLLPGALGLLGTLGKATMPRWAAIVSALSFLIAAMKTSGGPDGSPFQNVMMAAALGLLLAVALAIRPEKS